MAAKVFQTGPVRRSGAGDIGWSRVPLGLLHGERAASALRKAGVAGAPRRSRIWHRRRPRGAAGAASASFEVHAARESAVDGVVVALPHYCTESVLPPGALPGHVRPSGLASSPIVNVHVHFDRRVTELPFVAGIGTDAQWVFDRTASSGAGTGQYLAVSISAADDYVGPARATWGPRLLRRLRALFPCRRPAKVLEHLRYQGAPRNVPRIPGLLSEPGVDEDADAWARPGGGMDGHGVATHHGKCCPKRGKRGPRRARRHATSLVASPPRADRARSTSRSGQEQQLRPAVLSHGQEQQVKLQPRGTGRSVRADRNFRRSM